MSNEHNVWKYCTKWYLGTLSRLRGLHLQSPFQEHSCTTAASCSSLSEVRLNIKVNTHWETRQWGRGQCDATEWETLNVTATRVCHSVTELSWRDKTRTDVWNVLTLCPEFYLVDTLQLGAFGRAVEADRIVILCGQMWGLQGGAHGAAGGGGGLRCRLKFHLRVLGWRQQSSGWQSKIGLQWDDKNMKPGHYNPRQALITGNIYSIQTEQSLDT